MDKNIRICIVGPGAIGGVVAAVLTQKGFNIELVTKYPELAEKISSLGIEVSGYCGNFTQVIPSVATCDELRGVFDYVLIATKGDALEEAAKAIFPFLKEDSRVVSMQNGICVNVLAEVVGMERAVGCVVGWGGILLEPGKVRMNSGGECVLGNWKREPDEKLKSLAKIMGQVIHTRTTGDILSELYSKLIINSCISTLGVLSGLYLGEILSIRSVRKIIMEMIRESIQVAGAMGIRVAPGARGKLDYYKFVAPGFLADFKRHLTIRVVGLKYRKHKSYNLQHLARGRKTEVDYYNGYIADMGREFGVPTPVHAQLTQMVHEIEEGKRQISPANFKEVKF